MQKICFQNIMPKVFQSLTIQSEVWGQSLCFERGQTYLIEAESGRGKSTLCSYMVGYRDDYAGKLLFDDADARSFSIAQWTEIRQRRVSMLFQELRLFSELTAMENVLIKNQLTSHLSPQKIEEYFEMLGIADKKNERVALLSFGQQQRVAMIRALAQPFDFLVADEPVSHLDERNAQAMASLLCAEAKRQGAAVIITSIGKHMPMHYDKTIML
ncbi:MAG: ATP-binding cassette domain-containing protein [Prevotella sp.]|nr:ATP-binding cassette domain-containing protein [Prevotella sp.]